ncbi:YceI family protein [Sinomonas sp. ASV486]|uniref:YceI family protein n=1 Tax=Sinomonas sp. ASV486 TaxID=3051170 RepID=UPI0027DB2F68|nr:YceI family protein [Sinomonas sp. ASV486]MDQ4492021.1 YceI family protein [Sinomonas sp. ASV486]
MTKRALLVPLGIVVAVILAVVIGGPIISSALSPKQVDPFSVTAGASQVSTTPRPTGADNGTWTVGSGSQAGYRVNEVLNGNAVAVVGRTDRVTGSATVANGNLTAASIAVEAGTIATDNSGRDNYFRFTVISAGKYPQATFTLNSPVTLPEIGGTPVEVKVPGTLALAGAQRAVTADLQVLRDGDRIVAVGTIPIAVKDFGIDPPNLGFVKVEDHAQVEFRVNLSQGG